MCRVSDIWLWSRCMTSLREPDSVSEETSCFGTGTSLEGENERRLEDLRDWEV